MSQYIVSISYIILCLFASCSTDRTINEIDRVFRKLHNQAKFSGNILIAEKGEILYAQSFGHASYDSLTPLAPKSIFNIASVSKLFTAVSIMQLVEKGLLNLDEPVTNYLDTFPYSNIKVRHLLNHTSGLPRIQSQPLLNELIDKPLNNQEVLDVFNRVEPELQFAPGQGFLYANSNHLLLSLIIEEISGETYLDYLKNNIFSEAGMKETFLKKERVPKQLQSRIVSSHRKLNWLSDDFTNTDLIERDIHNERTTKLQYGYSDIHATTRDLLKFHKALQNGVLLSHESLKEMYAPLTPINNKEHILHPSSNYPAYIGITWKVAQDTTAGKIVFHSGGHRGTRSFFIRNIDKDQVIIILTNNEETERFTFTFPMRAINNQHYKLDQISLARVFANEYVLNGIDSAIQLHSKASQDSSYLAMDGWDFEEIGAEISKTGNTKDLIELFKLYTEQYSDEYSWQLLGDTYLSLGDKNKAKECYENSLETNPQYGKVIESLEQLESE